MSATPVTLMNRFHRPGSLPWGLAGLSVDPHHVFCFFLLTPDLKGEAEGGCSHVI